MPPDSLVWRMRHSGMEEGFTPPPHCYDLPNYLPLTECGPDLGSMHAKGLGTLLFYCVMETLHSLIQLGLFCSNVHGVSCRTGPGPQYDVQKLHNISV